MYPIREKRLAMVQQLYDQGTVYLAEQEYHRAIGSYLLALEIVEEWGTVSMATALLHCLGSIYQQLELYPRAIHYFQRALTHLPDDDEALRTATLQQLNQVLQRQKSQRQLLFC